MKARILAAGEGMRLHPLTLPPKPMLPVSGRPTLEWIIAWLRHHGIHDIVVNLYHQPDAVAGHFGAGLRLPDGVDRLSQQAKEDTARRMSGASGANPERSALAEAMFAGLRGECPNNTTKADLIPYTNEVVADAHMRIMFRESGAELPLSPARDAERTD